jgi:hypothetical protein
VDFVSLEYARDVCFPTAFGNYTQESIVRGFYGALKEPPYAVVFNTGIHDMNLKYPAGSSAATMYDINLRWLAKLLKDNFAPKGTKLFWVTTSDRRFLENPNEISPTHERIKEFNAIAARIMRNASIPTVDVYTVSRFPHTQKLARDSVHFGKRYEFYYRYVATEILKHICLADLG